jgi:hypothetical protein
MKDAAEGGQAGTFRFTRSSTAGALTVYFTAGGTATPGSDYEAIGNSVTFAAGSATAEKSVVAIDDSVTDPDEHVSVSVGYGPGYTAGSPSGASVIIADNEGVRRSALYLDFTPYKGPNENLPAHDVTLQWNVWDTAQGKYVSDEVVVDLPANADADLARSLFAEALRDNGLTVDTTSSHNRMVVKAGSGKILSSLIFNVQGDPLPVNLAGRIKLLKVTPEGDITPRLYIQDNQVLPP